MAGYRLQVTLLIAASIGGVLFGAVGVAVVVRYAQLLESGAVVPIFGREYPAQESFMLVCVASVSGAVLILGAVLTFSARLRAVRIGTEFQLDCGDRVLATVGGEVESAHAYAGDRYLRSELSKLHGRDARICGMAVRRLLDAVAPVAVMIGGMCALFWLHVSSSFVMLAVIGLALPAYYFVNLGAARATRRFEIANRRARRAARELFVGFSFWPPAPLPREVVRGAESRGVLRASALAFRERFAALARAEFISYGVTAAAFVLLLIYLGRDAIAGRMQWASLAAYLVILRLTVMAMRRLFQTATMISRYYPSIYRCSRFLAVAIAESGETSSLDEVHIRIGRQALTDGGKRRLIFRKGDFVGLTGPLSPNRYSILYYAKLFVDQHSAQGGRRALDQIRLIAPLAVPPVPASVRELLGLRSDWGAEEVKQRLSDWADELGRVGALDPDRVLEPTVWQQISLECRRQLALLGAEASTCPILLASSRVASAEWLRSQPWTRDRLVFLWYPGRPPRALGMVAPVHIVAGASTGVVAVGSPLWVRNSWEKIQDLLDAETRRVREFEGNQLDDEEG